MVAGNALTLEEAGEKEESIIRLKRSIELDPGDPEALNYLGYMYAEENKNLDEAEALIKKALRISPENGAYIDSLGWVYFKKGMFEEARKELEKARAIIGEDPVVYDHLGDVYLKTGSLDKAKEAWIKSIELKEDKKVKEKLETLKMTNDENRMTK